MQIAQNKNEFAVLDFEEIHLHDELPANVYELKLDPLRGFWLEKLCLEGFKSKLYGRHQDIIDKIFRRYSLSEGNMGVLLSGPSGTGKSVIARNLAVELSKNIPVVIVKSYYGEEMLSFISKFEGRMMVIFDEFEKTFPGLPPEDPSTPPPLGFPQKTAQESLLSFLDGIDRKQEKLFVLTVNDLNRVNKYLIGRPGRIKYHFRMKLPSHSDIRSYLQDNLKEERKNILDEAASRLAAKMVSWDSLSNIVSELNVGERLDSTMEDLNISATQGEFSQFIATFTYDDGEVSADSKLVSNLVGVETFIAKHSKEKNECLVDIDLTTVTPQGYGTYKVIDFTPHSEFRRVKISGITIRRPELLTNIGTADAKTITL